MSFDLNSEVGALLLICYKCFVQDGPTEYMSRTIFEDAAPELVKDFYWDDEFRSEWDDMIIYMKSLASCPETGAEIAHWVRKVSVPNFSSFFITLSLRAFFVVWWICT